MLLAVVLEEADGSRRERDAQKKAWHAVAERGWKWA